MTVEISFSSLVSFRIRTPMKVSLYLGSKVD